MDEFANKFSKFVKNSATSKLKLIIDVRQNTGGDSFYNFPLLKEIIKMADHFSSIFVLISRLTFSAAGHFIFQLEQYTDAIFVGEPSGCSPTFYSDPEVIRLPSSTMPFRICTSFWKMSHAFDDRKTLTPDIMIPQKFSDYLKNVDAVLDYALTVENLEKISLHKILMQAVETNTISETLAHLISTLIIKRMQPSEYSRIKGIINNLVKDKKFDDAIQLAVFTKDLFKSHAAIILLAEIYAKSGNKKNAKTLLQQAMKNFPDIPLVEYKFNALTDEIVSTNK